MARFTKELTAKKWYAVVRVRYDAFDKSQKLFEPGKLDFCTVKVHVGEIKVPKVKKLNLSLSYLSKSEWLQDP